MIRAVAFDFCWTLAYRRTTAELAHRAAERTGHDAVAVEAFLRARAAVADDVDVQQAERLRDRSREHHRTAEFSYAVASGADMDLMESYYLECLAPDAFIAYPDTEDVLRVLHERGVPLAVISNCGWDVDQNLDHLGLLGYFQIVLQSCDLGIVKPDRRIFLHAADRLGIAPSEVLMVGDTPATDGRAAEAGLTALVLPPVHNGHERGLSLALGLL